LGVARQIYVVGGVSTSIVTFVRNWGENCLAKTYGMPPTLFSLANIEIVAI
jgi:hypothetical protein